MIIELKDLPEIRNKFSKQKIIFAGGVFDVFHPTHVKALKNLKAIGDIVVIGIVSDDRVKQRKGEKRPILSEMERMEIVDAIRYVDYVTLMPKPSSEEPYPTMVLLRELRPDIFVSVDKKWLKYRDVIDQIGVDLQIVERIHQTSSTSIIERILKKEEK